MNANATIDTTPMLVRVGVVCGSLTRNRPSNRLLEVAADNAATAFAVARLWAAENREKFGNGDFPIAVEVLGRGENLFAERP